jgi:predicted CXXCH cytochrome family protein
VKNARFLTLFGVLLLVLLPARTVLANGGPHGDYAPTTDECATCHRSHTADGPNLLNSPAQNNDFCYTCHNGTGASATPIISTHGNSDFAGGAEADFSLLCVQCHNPHGSTNLSIVKEEVMVQAGLPLVTTGPVIFTAHTGANSFDDGVSDLTSRICTACHSSSANSGYPMTFHSGGANHLGGLDFTGQNCISCHPHSADNDRATLDGFMPVGGGCVGCHSVPQDNGDGLPVNGRRAIIPDFENTSHHVAGIVEDDDCLACHNVALHAAGQVRLVDADDPLTILTLNGRPDTDPLSAQVLEPFCLACHDSDGAGGFAPFHDGLMPPIISETMWNSATHASASTCYDCHSNGHGSVKDNLLAPWDALADVSLPGDPLREEEGLCYTCHDGDGPAASNIQAAFSQTSHHNVSGLDQADGSQVECVNCHNPHTVNAANQLANPDNLAALWAGDDTSFCLTCHDGAPPSTVAFSAASGTGFNKTAYIGSTHGQPLGDYGCRHCHEQHGSANHSLLVGAYATADYTPYASFSYQLCWACHDENGTIWQMNRFRNQHSRHVNNADTPCIVCHDVHAPYDAGETGLINFNFAVLRGYDIAYLAGYDGSSSFTIDLAQNRGTCSIACHGRTHTNRIYMRGSAIPTNCTACHPGGVPLPIILDSIMPIEMGTETPTAIGSPTGTATAPSPTVSVTATATVPTLTPIGQPSTTMIPTATTAVTPTPTVTFTPTPTLTPSPTPTPTVHERGHTPDPKKGTPTPLP